MGKFLSVLVIVLVMLAVSYRLREYGLLKRLLQKPGAGGMLFLDVTIPYSENRPAQYTDQLLQGLCTLGGHDYVLNIHVEKDSPTSLRIGGPKELVPRMEAMVRAAYPTASLVHMEYSPPPSFNFVCFVPQDLYLPFRNYAYDRKEFPVDPLSQTITLLSESVAEGESLDFFIFVRPAAEKWKKKLSKGSLSPLTMGLGMGNRPSVGGVTDAFRLVKEKVRRFWRGGLWGRRGASTQGRQSPGEREEEREVRKRIEDKLRRRGMHAMIFLVSETQPPPVLTSLGQSCLDVMIGERTNVFVPYPLKGKRRQALLSRCFLSFSVAEVAFFSPANLAGEPPVLTTAEIATMWHVADAGVEDPSVQKGTLRELPPPINLPLL